MAEFLALSEFEYESNDPDTCWDSDVPIKYTTKLNENWVAAKFVEEVMWDGFFEEDSEFRVYVKNVETGKVYLITIVPEVTFEVTRNKDVTENV